MPPLYSFSTFLTISHLFKLKSCASKKYPRESNNLCWAAGIVTAVLLDLKFSVVGGARGYTIHKSKKDTAQYKGHMDHNLPLKKDGIPFYLMIKRDWVLNPKVLKIRRGRRTSTGKKIQLLAGLSKRGILTKQIKPTYEILKQWDTTLMDSFIIYILTYPS